jgi:hypothetical protein
MRFVPYLIRFAGTRSRREYEVLERALLDSGSRLRHSVPAGAQRVARVEAGLAPRLAEARRGHGEWIARGVESLRLELTPMCGAGSADRALRLAARRCSGVDLNALTEAHWPAFIDHLGPILASLCGISAVQAVLGASAFGGHIA